MRYALTGHTNGIGKALFNKLENVQGFSKSTGYDINDKNHRKQIIDQCENIDVFINNVHDNFAQTYMLLEMFYAWKDTNKTIINVGSEVAEDTTILKNYEYLLEYQIQKKALKVLHYDLLKLNYAINLKYVYFGYVGTERILKKYPDITPDRYITVDQAVNIILA